MPRDNQHPVSHQLRALAEAKQIPISVTIELTYQCNLTCSHCYNFDRSDSSKLPILPNPEEELTRTEILQLIDDLAKAQTLYLTFTGGEPTLHPNIVEFIERGRSHHMSTRLKSNGIIKESLLEPLRDAGLHGVDISLYGTTPSSHDSITNHPGSFNATTKTIKRLRNLGVPVHVNFVVSRHSFHEVADMEQLATSLDVTQTVTLDITTRYDGTDSSQDLRISPEQTRKLYEGPLRSLLPPPDFSPERSVRCGCALASCAVSRLGEVYPCIGAPLPSGNIRKQSFENIWAHSPELNSIRAHTLDDFSSCKPCALRPHCNRSSGNIYVTTGNYTGPEEWACAEAQARKDAWGNLERGESTP